MMKLCSSFGVGVGRRPLVGFAVLAMVAALLGCSDQATGVKALAPVEIGTATTCELDGMLLADYPGPKAQIFYADAAEPIFMCDTVEMFNTLLQPEQVRKVVAVYVQDMGKAETGWMQRKVFLCWEPSATGPWAPPLPAFHWRVMLRRLSQSGAANCCATRR